MPALYLRTPGDDLWQFTNLIPKFYGSCSFVIKSWWKIMFPHVDPVNLENSRLPPWNLLNEEVHEQRGCSNVVFTAGILLS